MRTFAFLLTGTVVLSMAAWIYPTEAVDTSPQKTADKLVVHEWGTFTNFSGSDGVKLDFRALVEDDLPPFVLDRSWQSGQLQLFLKRQVQGRQRMETPVTYFYTDREREVNVRVGFPEGLLTEFYPPVKGMSPAFTFDQFHKRPELGNSELDWGKVTLIPESHLRSQVTDEKLSEMVNNEIMNRLIPQVGNSVHYEYARETDSAIVHVHADADPARPRMPVGNFFEKFLFYRGVGNFELPLHLEAIGQEQFQLTNNGKQSVQSLFLVTVQGDELRFQAYDGIQPGATLSLNQSESVSSVDQLGEAVVEALTAQGLYEKESRAMVKTWRESWFGEEGTRLFYVVPTEITNELLPLHIDPQPTELVRVLVGRMEIMAPEDEAKIRQLVLNSMHQRAEHAKQAQEARKKNENIPEYAIPDEIVKLGRLAEPALVRVIGVSDDINVRREGRLLLKQFQQQFEVAPIVAEFTNAGQ